MQRQGLSQNPNSMQGPYYHDQPHTLYNDNSIDENDTIFYHK